MPPSVLKGVGATLVSEAVGRGAAMGFQMVVANQLGADRFGSVALALASAALLAPLADAGLPNLALRKVSGSPDDLGLIRTLLGLKLGLVPLFLVPLTVWALILPGGEGRSAALVWAGVFYGFQAASDLFRQILRARQDVKQELAARFAYPAGNVLALLLVWRLHPGPSGALLALASGPVALTLSYLAAFPRGARTPRMDAETAHLGRAAAPALLQTLAYLTVAGFATRVDAFLLEHHANRTEVGRYFAALNLVMAGSFFGQGLSSYLYPRLHRQRERRGRALLRSVMLQLGLGLSMWAAIAVLGPHVVRLVYRAHSFQGLEPLLPGLGLVLCLSCLDWLWISILVGSDRIWVVTINLAPALVAKLLLAPLWIPAYGSIGMVRAAVVGQIVTTSFGAVTAVTAYLRGAPNRA